MLKVLTNAPLNHDDSCDVRCFDGLPARNSAFDPKRLFLFDNILKNLPDGWVPDLVFFKTPQFYPIPINIERSSFLTVIKLDDWFGSMDYLPDNLERFDYIFADKYSVDLLATMGFTNVNYWPWLGFDPTVFHTIPEESRTIDLTFAGSFNVNIQTKRLPYLRRLCSLPSKYSIQLFHSVWGHEYVKVLNRSKIVFNRSIKGEMNMRCFEAPACGALLFIEEENREVRAFLEPGRECVVYSDANLEQLVKYYLENDDERTAIANAGREKILQFTDARLFSSLLEKINTKNLVAGHNRCKPRRYTTSALHRDFVQVNLSLRGRTHDALKIISSLIQGDDVPALVLNDCAVILLAFIEDRLTSLGSAELQKLYGYCRSLLDKAVENQKGYRTPLFNCAQMLFTQKLFDEAATVFRKLLLDPVSRDMNNYNGQVYPIHYLFPLRYLWSDAVTVSIQNGQDLAKARHDVIVYISCLRLAEIEQSNGNKEEALSLLKKAIAIMPDHPVALSAYTLQAEQKNNSAEDRDFLVRALTANPFSTKHWERYAQILTSEKKNNEAKRFAEDCLLCLSRVQVFHEKSKVFFEEYLKEIVHQMEGSEL